jgi:hypothetical protein
MNHLLRRRLHGADQQIVMGLKCFNFSLALTEIRKRQGRRGEFACGERLACSTFNGQAG